MSVKLTIDGEEVQAEDGATILEAADACEMYIPRLCYHPGLGSSHGLKPQEKIFRGDEEKSHDGSGPAEGFEGCRLCLVEIEGREGLITSCDTPAEEGMVVSSGTEDVKKARRDNLAELLRDHPHACLRCAQQEGCSRTQCSTNVPEDERCCVQLGHCEVQKVAGYVGIREDLTKYVPAGLPKLEDEPLFTRDYNLCISCLRCVRACRDLRGINTLGFVYRDGKAFVGPSKASSFSESDCRFCGACAEVCPTGAIMDKDLPPGEKEAALVPCIANCPAGIDVPAYIERVRQGDPSGAVAVIRERLPFPHLLGLVCFHPCQDACRRGELNTPMAICALKRFAAENDDGSWKERVGTASPTGKKAAVVGSGPAGLSAAYYLALKGHSVTVFEAEDKPGGMLRYGIPDYRVPPDALDAELRPLEEMAIEFKTGTRVGEAVKLEALKADFDAVFIGTGATMSKRIPVGGCEMEGVDWGVDFLKQVKKGERTGMSGSGVVIGGGNVAIDVARTALRLGAQEVQLACLESDEEMPAHDWELEEAKEEGVIMNPSWGPKEITDSEGKLSGIELVKCTSVFDEGGNFAPKFDDSTCTCLDADWVILAIGQASDLSFAEGLRQERGALKFNDDDMSTGTAGLFTGGEAARGPSSVVEAVADGARAASAMDKYLGGDGEVYPTLRGGGAPEDLIGEAEGFAAMGLVEAGKVPAAERKQDFGLVERCYDDEGARREAERCLRCDLRLRDPPGDPAS